MTGHGQRTTDIDPSRRFNFSVLRRLVSALRKKENPRRKAGGYGNNSLAGRPAFPPRQDTLRFSADVLP